MITPAMRVIISNVPPFISHDKIMSVLSRYGKMVSRMSTIPLGYRNECVRHVMSFRRQVYMVLPDRGEDTGLNISFKINFEDINYQIYTSSAILTCFQFGAFRHLKCFCPKASCTRCGKTGHTNAGYREEVTGPLPVNVPNEKEVTVSPPSNVMNEEETSGSTINNILPHIKPLSWIQNLNRPQVNEVLPITHQALL